jgi:hypothetical protein
MPRRSTGRIDRVGSFQLPTKKTLDIRDLQGRLFVITPSATISAGEGRGSEINQYGFSRNE